MRTTKPTGYLLHEGTTPSGAPFVAVATMKTSNEKTGNMVQIWFLLRDVNPVEAVQTGLDASTICSGCPFASGNGCYVNVGQAPQSVWRAYHRGRYPLLALTQYQQVFAGRKIRFGAYGNPSLLPLDIVRDIARASAGWTGYYHDWRENPQAAEYAQYFMASTETESSRAQAENLGYRYFHASPTRPEGARECLAETHALKCAECGLCAGLAKINQRPIWINPHGSGVAKATAVAIG
jgi:hypothetical protein